MPNQLATVLLSGALARTSALGPEQLDEVARRLRVSPEQLRGLLAQAESMELVDGALNLRPAGAQLAGLFDQALQDTRKASRRTERPYYDYIPAKIPT